MGIYFQKKNIAQLEDPFKDLDIDSFDSLDQLKRSDQSALVTKLAQVMEQKTGTFSLMLNLHLSKKKQGVSKTICNIKYCGSLNQKLNIQFLQEESTKKLMSL